MKWPTALSTREAFDAAVTFFRSKSPVDSAAYSAMRGAAKDRAFAVAGVAELDLASDVMAAVDAALRDGTTLADFNATIGDRLEAAWGGTVRNPGARLETIFRTNVQSAYSAGRVAEATHPDVLADRPYWLFDAVMDSRTTPVCIRANGTVLPAGNPWWQTHTPPCHFNCRSTIITLTKQQAAAYPRKTPTQLEPDEGFGGRPTVEAPDAWARDAVATAPPALAKLAQQKLAL